MFEKILITMGLSTPPWSMIPYIRYLATQFGSEVHFLGIATEPQQVWDQSLMDYVESLAGDFREENIVTKTNFIYGNPAVEVVKYSNKHGINLVVTNAGSRNEITCTVLSNIAKRMGKSLNIPVLIIPPKDYKESDRKEKVSFYKILVPLDSSQIGEAILPYIQVIAKKVKSKVTLLHVNTAPVRGVPVLHSEVAKISRASGLAYVKRMRKLMRQEGIDAEFAVVDGTPVKTILKYASENKFDLIAMGTRGSSGIIGWMFGSLTKKISERANLPLLTVGYSETDLTEYPIEDKLS